VSTIKEIESSLLDCQNKLKNTQKCLQILLKYRENLT